jgi:hypothetical protein
MGMFGRAKLVQPRKVLCNCDAVVLVVLVRDLDGGDMLFPRNDIVLTSLFDLCPTWGKQIVTSI